MDQYTLPTRYCQTRDGSIYTANMTLSDKRGDRSLYITNWILSDKIGGEKFAGVVSAVDRYSNKPYLLNLALKG